MIQQNTTKNICKYSNKYINSLKHYSTHSKTLYNYKKIIKNNINILTKGSSIIKIQHIYQLKNNTTLDNIKCNIYDINSKPLYKIPNYKTIFLYSIHHDIYVKNHLTSTEIQLLNTILTTSKTIEDIDSSPICKKFKSIFYNSILNSSTSNSIITKFPELTFHKLLINDFTNLSFINHLKHEISRIAIITFTYKNIKNYNLYILFNHKTTTNTYLNKLANELCKRIVFFNDLLNNDTIPEKIIIFLSDLEKEIDQYVCDHLHFRINNINSAVTNKQDIIIYRKQEILKSIFHELIHFHSLDTIHIPNKIINHLQNTHNIKPQNNYLLYECITESLANILNIIYHSKNINIFKTNLQNEILFSTLQISKILKICNYNSWEEFTLQNYTRQPTKYFKQDSCVFSYYILKLYVLLNFNEYFNNCLDTHLKFISSTNSFIHLQNIFDHSRNSYELKLIINLLLKNLPVYKKKLTKVNKILKTLRMTCI